jgi:TnpA family transposase
MLSPQFAPRIKDLKDRKLYSIENPGKYSLIGNTIDPAAIISQWPELLRFKTSIDAGCGFLPSVILRKLDC